MTESAPSTNSTPKTGSYFNERGLARRKKRDFAGAISDFGLAIELDPENAFTYLFNRADTHYWSGHALNARSDLSRAIELDPENVAAYTYRGELRFRDMLLDEAIEDFSRIIELEPENIGAYVSRGFAKNRQGDQDGALTDFEKAIEIRPERAHGYVGRGAFHFYNGRTDESLVDFDRAIELEPDNAEGYRGRGSALLKKGEDEDDEAFKALDRANELDSDSPSMNMSCYFAKATKGLRERERLENLALDADNGGSEAPGRQLPASSAALKPSPAAATREVATPE